MDPPVEPFVVKVEVPVFLPRLLLPIVSLVGCLVDFDTVAVSDVAECFCDAEGGWLWWLLLLLLLALLL